MKSFVALAALVTLAVANPITPLEDRATPVADLVAFEKRAVGITSKEFTLGGCRDIILFFARGSTEPGNMGSSVGPALANQLKAKYGEARVAAEGIDYGALLSTNFNPGGADYAGIAEMKRLVNLAATKCPNSKFITSGYSQGAALTHRAVESLSSSVMAQIGAAVTFGDTQKQQDGARIKNFPQDKTLIICNTGDLVCLGTLTILAPHLDYVRRVPEAVTFIASKIQ